MLPDYALVLALTPAGIAAIAGCIYGVRRYRRRRSSSAGAAAGANGDRPREPTRHT
jgi:hypothetical protein